MTSSRTILKSLIDLDQYLAQFHPSHRSAYFEKFIAEVFSHILCLPFYTIDNDDTNVSYRITWQGGIKPVSRARKGKPKAIAIKAPQEEPDAIAYCYNFHLIVEATKNTGANQWAREFAPSIRHCENFVRQSGAQPNEVYIILATPRLHQDTYRSISCSPKQEYRFIPIETSAIAKILETSILAFTMRHLELRRLFHEISDCIRNSSSITDFSKSVDESISKWQVNILKSEKSAFIGVKSYEAMRKIGRTHIGVSEILQKLQKHWVVRQYFNIVGDRISSNIIEDSLINQSLASRLTSTFEGEELFEPVPCVDFKGRGLRMIDAVVKIG